MVGIKLFERAVSRVILALSPRWALARETARRTYEAVKSSPQRRPKGSNVSANASLYPAGDKLRAYARHLDENHDLAIGILDVLVNNIVGTGITVEPMIARKNGKLIDKVNNEIRALWDEWAERPEVTRTYSLAGVQRLACRAWLRDGEVMAQLVTGNRSDLAHYSDVPLSLEMLEADFLPFDLVDESRRLVHGVQLDAWGKPLVYWLHKGHPGEMYGLRPAIQSELKPVPAYNLVHLKFARRFHQIRGVSIFHGVLTRLDDIKDYEESERIAARVAAAFTAMITLPSDVSGARTNANGDQAFEMSPGMVFRGNPGETVETISSDRPNPNVAAFITDQMRRVASGVGSSASSISKNYNGTWSSQRQEIVETAPSYKVMRDTFIAQFMQVIYQLFIDMAIAAGRVSIPAGVDPYKCAWHGVGMPWVDPEKETKADILAIQSRLKSRHQVIRERGGDPRIVDDQIRREREIDSLVGYTTSDAAQTSTDKSDDTEEEAAA